jgi:hypothetical protein
MSKLKNFPSDQKLLLILTVVSHQTLPCFDHQFLRLMQVEGWLKGDLKAPLQFLYSIGGPYDTWDLGLTF